MQIGIDKDGNAIITKAAILEKMRDLDNGRYYYDHDFNIAQGKKALLEEILEQMP